LWNYVIKYWTHNNEWRLFVISFLRNYFSISKWPFLSNRKNYYDDVIDYLNSKQKGIYRELPRAQEWAERTIRTYDQKNIDKSFKRSSDMKYITNMTFTGRHYSYHTRAYYSLKYQKILWIRRPLLKAVKRQLLKTSEISHIRSYIYNLSRSSLIFTFWRVSF